jgi:hypothetical protein
LQENKFLLNEEWETVAVGGIKGSKMKLQKCATKRKMLNHL